MPGPWSRTVTSPSRTVTSTVPPGGLHLAALSSRLPTARSSCAAGARHEGRRGVEGEGQAGRVQARPVDRPPHEGVQAQVLALLAVLGPARQADDVAHQAAEVLELGGDVAQQPPPLAGLEPVVVGQHLDVGPQGGERRAQLVGGVHDQPALALLGGLQGREHLVEGAGQARHLVAALHVDAAAEVAGVGDLLGGAVQAPHRRQARARHGGGEQAGQGDARDADQGERPAQLPQRVVHVLQRQRHLHGAAVAERGGQHAHAAALEARVADEGLALAGGDLADGVVHRQLRAVAAPPVAGKASPASADTTCTRPPAWPRGAVGMRPSSTRPKGPGGRRCRAGATVAYRSRSWSSTWSRSWSRTGDVDQRRHQGDDDGHRRGDAQREPRPDRHRYSSRSTYPTPRTVWMSRGSPPSSSLRRRLEM